MVNVNDKVVLVKNMGMFDNIGEVFNVKHVDDNYIIFTSENRPNMLCTTHDEFHECFVPYEEPECDDYYNIEDILDDCEIIKSKAFDKCMIVACRMPNGHVIVEHCDTCCPEHYDEMIAYEICLNNIIDKIYELERYADAQINMMLDDVEDDGEDDDCNENEDEECSNLNTIKNNNKFDKIINLDIPVNYYDAFNRPLRWV